MFSKQLSGKTELNANQKDEIQSAANVDLSASNSNAEASSVESRKIQIRALYGLPDIKIKIHSEYEKDPRLRKTKGTKGGAWFFRSNSDLSKQSRWLFKEGGGYGKILGSLPQAIVSEISAIKEAYAGELYRIFIEDHVPKTRLVVKDNHNKTMSPRLAIGSKRIVDFNDIDDLKAKGIKIVKSFLPEEYGKQIIKMIIVAVLLGESDFNDGGIGFTNNRFIKVDHGESLYLDQAGVRFRDDLNFTPEYLADISCLDIKYFTEENIREALAEIVETMVNKANQLTSIETSYESILSTYRKQFGVETFRLLGKEENTIASSLEKRMQATQEEHQRNQSPKIKIN